MREFIETQCSFKNLKILRCATNFEAWIVLTLFPRIHRHAVTFRIYRHAGMKLGAY